MEEVWVIGVVLAIKPSMVKSKWLKKKRKFSARIWESISYSFSTSSVLGVLVYIRDCFFLLVVGGALMVVSMWYL